MWESGGIRIGRIWDVSVEIHLSFVLVLLWGGWQGWFQFRTLVGIIYGILAVGMLFGCVLLHELGHAIQARRLGLSVRRVILLPVGGMAELETSPAYPWYEMLIALAGPLVNLGIALLVGAVLAVLEPVPLTWFDQIRLLDTPGVNSLLRYIFLTNILLFIFNLLPAFPMDGGRIVRGGLATLFDFSLATRVAGGLAIFLSVALALYAVFRVKNVAMIILLLILAGITVMGAVQEIMVVRRRRALVLLRIGDITDLSTVNLAPWDEIDSSLLKRIIRDESTIPVLVDGRVVGVLNYRHLRRQIPGHKRETVAHLMESTFPVVTVQDTLWAAFREMVAVRLTGLPVMDGEQYAGMLTVRHIERAAQYRPRRVEVRKNL